MSQSPIVGGPPATQVIVQQPAGNRLGVAGFVASLLGVLTCGLLCPLGVVLSLFGMFRAPRGLAIAGFLLGAIGSWWLIIIGWGIVASALGIGAAQDAAIPAKAAEEDPPAVEAPAEEVEATPDVRPKRKAPAETSVEEQPLLDGEDDVESAGKTDVTVSPGLEPERVEQPAKPAEPTPAYRWWSDASGRFRIEAAYGGRTGSKVRLTRKDNGKLIEIALDKLSASDQQWVAEQH